MSGICRRPLNKQKFGKYLGNDLVTQAHSELCFFGGNLAFPVFGTMRLIK